MLLSSMHMVDFFLWNTSTMYWPYLWPITIFKIGSLVCVLVACILQGRFNDVPVILENSEPRSRFGYAIGDVGDLNADGYEGNAWMRLHIVMKAQCYVMWIVVDT